MTGTMEVRIQKVHSRTRQYRARCEARQLCFLTACSLLLPAGMVLLMRGKLSPGVAAVADGYGAVLLQDGAGAYIVIGLLTFALGVAATVLYIRLKDKAARTVFMNNT